MLARKVIRNSSIRSVRLISHRNLVHSFARAFASDDVFQWKTYMAILAVAPAILISKSLCDDRNEYMIQGEKFKEALQARLDLVRKELKPKIGKAPAVSFSIPECHRSGSKPRPNEDLTYAVSFTLDKYNDAYSLLSMWLKVVGKGRGPEAFTTEVRTGDNYHETVFIANDKSTSLRARSDTEKSGLRVQTISLYQENGFSQRDMEWIIDGYKEALLGGVGHVKTTPNKSHDMEFMRPGMEPGSFYKKSGSNIDPTEQLMALGVEVFDQDANADLKWDSLAGYEDVKRDIEETIINALKYPEVYLSVTQKTRESSENNLPKAVLLEGPPGTGKTLTARILASRVDRPLVHLKLENVMSKFYGESNNNLAKIMDLCEQLDGSILFIDEVDALAVSRDNGHIHEESRRVLSQLLQRVEGFHGKGKTLLVCATNRKQDLDAALLSRFDLCIQYKLPDVHTRAAVFARYAKQLAKSDKELNQLAMATEGFSCRDIKEVCEHAERQWANRKIRNEEGLGEAPTASDYLKCVQIRTAAKTL